MRLGNHFAELCIPAPRQPNLIGRYKELALDASKFHFYRRMYTWNPKCQPYHLKIFKLISYKPQNIKIRALKER